MVEVKDFHDGRLVENTLDYYAQKDDGSVWSFGERVDNYVDGEVVSHEGSWLAGEGGAQPGLYVPASPRVGDVFEPEKVPGVAEDTSTVVGVGVDLATPAGDFSGCLETETDVRLEGIVAVQHFCPGAGLVRIESEDEHVELTRYE